MRIQNRKNTLEIFFFLPDIDIVYKLMSFQLIQTSGYASIIRRCLYTVVSGIVIGAANMRIYPRVGLNFEKKKLKKNELRDQIVQAQLAAHGIKCLIIWECTIKKVQKKTGNREQLLADIENFRNDYLQLTTKSQIKQKHICQMRHKLGQISTNIGQKMGQKSLIKHDNADNMYICSG